RVFAEKTLTPLLQPASSLQFSQLLQALQHISSGGHTSGQEEVSKERLPDQRALRDQTATYVLLRFQNQEWGARDSHIKRETLTNTFDQAYSRGCFPTRVTVRSFTLTRTRLSPCIPRDAPKIECTSTVGVDRNLYNLTVGNDDQTHHYDLSETVRIAKVTARIVSSFKRNDVRLRKVVASKYGGRRVVRTRHSFMM